MSTRSITVFMDEAKKEILVMYRHSDGYPTGHGKDLAEFLKDITLVNGIMWGDTRKVANGMNCLAAQVVGHFKDSPGQFYLHKAKTRNLDEEFVYTIYNNKKNDILMKVAYPDGTELFKGIPSDFLKKAEAIEESANNREYEDV